MSDCSKLITCKKNFNKKIRFFLIFLTAIGIVSCVKLRYPVEPFQNDFNFSEIHLRIVDVKCSYVSDKSETIVEAKEPDDSECFREVLKNNFSSLLTGSDENDLEMVLDTETAIRSKNLPLTTSLLFLPPLVGFANFYLELETKTKAIVKTLDGQIVDSINLKHIGRFDQIGYPPCLFSLPAISSGYEKNFYIARQKMYSNILANLFKELEKRRELLKTAWENSQKVIKETDKKTTKISINNAETFVLSNETEKTFKKPSQIKNYFAVIIGISAYENKTISTLPYADDDAIFFTRNLNKLGWQDSHIRVLINEEATQKNIKIALESWLTKAGQDDMIVLFWSGHGYPDPDDPEKVYFACYDTDIRIPATGWRMDEVRRKLEERKARNVIILADTCHAGKLITRGTEKDLAIRPYVEKLKREENVPKGWVFMVSADTDRQAIEHTSWSNGAFTHCLLKGLSGDADGHMSSGVKDGVVTLGEIKEYLNTAMPDETQRVLGVAKHPVITTSTGDPNIWELSLKIK